MTAQRPQDLVHACPQVGAGEPQEPAGRDELPDDVQVDVATAVALASGRKHGVRTEQHAAVDALRQMDPEERVAGVGYRVDEPAHEVLG
ncbi:hypothetical protein ASE25_11560 [Terrabacter sp. Root85]|nr:hypothetical protein ASE25_11560 [Terrabacter sp. Root85]